MAGPKPPTRGYLVKRGQIVFCLPLSVRSIGIIATFYLVCAAVSEDADFLVLERAVHLEMTVGDHPRAERLYRQLVDSVRPGHRVRAEAAFRLAQLYRRQKKNAEAKALFLQVLREFPEATDLTTVAGNELASVTALLTKDEIGTNLASMQHVGDLVIALEGALENSEMPRAQVLLDKLGSALGTLATGGDMPEILVRLKTHAEEIRKKLSAPDGGTASALQMLAVSQEFEPFRTRSFPADPNDVFAPAWRMKDRLARALASNHPDRSKEIALGLERYLQPIAALPIGPREGALARLTQTGVQEARALAEQRKFKEARLRLDQLNAERHEQFGDFRLLANLPARLPEEVVGSEWAILYRVDLARRELNRRAYPAAIDHITEAASICREVLTRLPKEDAAELFRKQLEALEHALAEARGERLSATQQSLKRVSETLP